MTDTSSEGLSADAFLTRLARQEPMRVQVQSALREMIVRGEFEPRQHIVESEVAARLRVSRQPVREALQALQQEGWLDLHVGRGAFVHSPTTREGNEVLAVRGVLEQEATRLATPRISAGDTARLRDLCRDGREAFTGGADDAAIVAANANLHRCITGLADNWVLTSLLGSLEQRVRWYLTPLVRRGGSHSWDEHDQIIDAMEAGDESGAAGLMRQHTENTTAAHNTV